MYWNENENLNVLIYNILETRKLKLIIVTGHSNYNDLTFQVYCATFNESLDNLDHNR